MNARYHLPILAHNKQKEQSLDLRLDCPELYLAEEILSLEFLEKITNWRKRTVVKKDEDE